MLFRSRSDVSHPLQSAGVRQTADSTFGDGFNTPVARYLTISLLPLCTPGNRMVVSGFRHGDLERLASDVPKSPLCQTRDETSVARASSSLGVLPLIVCHPKTRRRTNEYRS